MATVPYLAGLILVVDTSLGMAYEAAVPLLCVVPRVHPVPRLPARKGRPYARAHLDGRGTLELTHGVAFLGDVRVLAKTCDDWGGWVVQGDFGGAWVGNLD